MLRNIVSQLAGSVRRHGAGGTARLAGGMLAHGWFDLRHGTDTMAWVELDALDIASGNKRRGTRYAPTIARPLRRLLAALALPRDALFIDLGCGKVRVLLLALEHGFSRVARVEFSAELCAIARRNLARFRPRGGSSDGSQVWHGDAAEYEFAAVDSVVYLNNPFDAEVLGRVLDRLERLLAEHPVRVWLIYHDPVHRAAIERRNRWEPVGDFPLGLYGFAVYRTRKREGAAFDGQGRISFPGSA